MRTIMLGLFVCAGSCLAGNPLPAASIESDLDACIEREPSNAGSIACIETAAKRWDEELNRVYGQLMKQLPASARKPAREAQRKWIEFRDAEWKSIDAVHETMQGTMYAPMQAAARKDVVRRRVGELEHQLRFLEQHGGAEEKD